ncbi:MAG: 1-deoxy-D-xylulose-5-phosphate reductoisomerase [Acidobacteriota bacterium]
MKNLAILGSTGSIGRSSLDVVAAFPDRFRVVALAAGRSIEKLAEQVAQFRPELVSIDAPADVSRLQRLLPSGLSCRIVAGAEGLNEAATHADADTVVGGLVGALGLRSALAAIRAGKRLALANKEPLVVAGPLILAEAGRSGAEIVPVDSEHSAIHQAMRCGRPGEAHRLVLTASGGPFRERRLDTFDAITVPDALAHPTWKMGPKITIDSATMMNKGLEVIEAHFLFGLPEERIEVVIHPQSLIHSFVEFVDGSLMAQLAKNDMKFPIVYALSYPERLSNAFGRLDLVAMSRLDFVPVEPKRYPALGLARAALTAGGAMPAVLNASNEVAVSAFLEGKISFPDIVNVVSETMNAIGETRAPDSLEAAEQIDRQARDAAGTILRRRAAAVAT